MIFQYYFAESDIGENRADIALKKLAPLNTYVTVTCSSENITETFLGKNKVNVSFVIRNGCGFGINSQVFVLTDASLDDQIQVGNECRKHGIKFINANTKGLFG